MKALVTGGAGFIGSHLVSELLAQGTEVRILDNLEPRVHPAGKSLNVPKEAEFIHGDVRNPVAMAKALDGVELVFHQAAYQDYMPDYSKFFDTNVTGTALIFESLRQQKNQVRKVVVASSQAVYGEGQYDCTEHGVVQPPARNTGQMDAGQWELLCPICHAPVSPRLLEESYANPFNPYALSKIGQELAALRLGRLTGIPCTALRYSITQGPKQSPFNTYSGICRIFTQRLRQGLSPIIYEDGKQRRDYVHVKDVVAANLIVASSEVSDFEAYNVGSGTPTTVLEYSAQLAKTMGVDIQPIIPGKFRVGDNRHSVSNIAKLKGLGWKPVHSLERIMRDYVEWLDSSGMAGQFFVEAEKEMEALGVVRPMQGSHEGLHENGDRASRQQAS